MKLPLKVLAILFASTLITSQVLADEKADVLVYQIELMPFSGVVDGKAVGLQVDILREITAHGGPTFTFQTLPWKRAQALVKRNSGTAITSLSLTPERKDSYTWIAPLVEHYVRLTSSRYHMEHFNLSEPLTLESYKDLPVGVIGGQGIIPVLESLGFTKLESVYKTEQNALKLAHGRIAAQATSIYSDQYLWTETGQKAEDLIVGPKIGQTYQMHLAAGLDFSPELTQQIREALEKAKQAGAIEKIMEKWTNY